MKSELITSAMIVDDETIIREILKAILEDIGLTTILDVHSGERALALLKNQPVQLILLDINMSGLSGIETLKAIKKDHPACHVIMISGDSSLDKVKDALTRGAEDFIVKPFSPDKVADRIKSYLDAHQK